MNGDINWLPRPGDRMVLLSPQGRPLTTWRVESCDPVHLHPERQGLTITADPETPPGVQAAILAAARSRIDELLAEFPDETQPSQTTEERRKIARARTLARFAEWDAADVTFPALRGPDEAP